ncbi:MAG: hypothetical protein ACE5FU_01225, partial [Nitrospinota bacterium]
MRFFLFIFFPLFSFGFVDFAFGQNPEKITSYPSRDFQSGVSGNNRFLAFVSDRNGNDEIWLKDLLANRFSVPKQLTNHPAPDFSPSLNKDGTKLLYVSKKSDPRGDIYLLDRVTGVETRLTDMESEDSEPHWGADERTVYYLKYDYTLNQKTLFKYSLPEKKEVSLFRERVHSFCILKGGWIIYSDGRNILAVNENDLKKRQTLTTGKFIDIFPSTFDGTAVFFVRYPEKSNFDSTFSGEEGSSLWAVTTDSVSMERRRLFQITPNSSGTLYPAPTQKNLYYSDEAGGNIFRLKIQNFFKPYYSYETATKHVELLLESGKSVRALMVMGNMSRNTIRPGDQKKWEHFNFEFIRRLISAEKINQARNTLTTLHELSEGGKTLRDVFTKKITALQTMQSLSNVDKKKVAKNAVKEMLQTGQNHKTDPYLFGTLLIESGNLLAAIGDHADALDLLNKAARLQKEEIQTRALFSKATIYKVAGNLSGMTALFVEIAQKLGPNSSWGKQAIADAISASEQGESLKEKL